MTTITEPTVEDYNEAIRQYKRILDAPDLSYRLTELESLKSYIRPLRKSLYEKYGGNEIQGPHPLAAILKMMLPLPWKT